MIGRILKHERLETLMDIHLIVLNSDVTVTQLVVAVDGLSVVVKKGGAADQCLNSMGGISWLN